MAGLLAAYVNILYSNQFKIRTHMLFYWRFAYVGFFTMSRFDERVLLKNKGHIHAGGFATLLQPFLVAVVF